MRINYGYVCIVQNKRLNNLTGENIFKVGFSINPVGRLHGLEANCRVVDDWVVLEDSTVAENKDWILKTFW